MLYSTFKRANVILHRNTVKPQVEYLKNYCAEQMVDRLFDIKSPCSRLLDLGCGSGHIGKELDKRFDHDKFKDLLMIQCEASEQLLLRDAPLTKFKTERWQLDEEHLSFYIQKNNLNFLKEPFDVVTSCLSMHWINNLPSLIQSIHKVLKPDGCFMSSMFAGDTLFELRTSLQLAEQERYNGISNHISPMVTLQDMGGLLQSAGYTLLTMDMEDVVVNYPSMFELMDDLNQMGEGNSVTNMSGILHRDTLIAAQAIYQEIYGNPDGSIPATFQILHMIGWKPSPNQPKPVERGSAKKSLKQVLN